MPLSWGCLEDTEMQEADCFIMFFPATPMIPNRSFQGGNMTYLSEMIRRRKVSTTFYNAFCFGHLNLADCSIWLKPLNSVPQSPTRLACAACAVLLSYFPLALLTPRAPAVALLLWAKAIKLQSMTSCIKKSCEKKRHVSHFTCAWTHSSLSHSMLCCSSWN